MRRIHNPPPVHLVGTALLALGCGAAFSPTRNCPASRELSMRRVLEQGRSVPEAAGPLHEGLAEVVAGNHLAKRATARRVPSRKTIRPPATAGCDQATERPSWYFLIG